MATLQAVPFPSNQYCNEKHPLALRNNREEAGDVLKERHMDLVSISTHGVSFCLPHVSAADNIIPPVHQGFHTHTHNPHTDTPLCHRWATRSYQTLLEGQTDKRNEGNFNLTFGCVVS